MLLVGINFLPEKTGIGKYSGELCTELASCGHDVAVVTAPPYYPAWAVQHNYSARTYKKEKLNGVTVYRIPLYIPKKPSLFSRLLHLASFAFFSLPVLCYQIFWKPDLVINVVPTYFSTPMSLVVAKVSGAKSWLHIQDYEIDAMFDLGISSSFYPIKRMLSVIEVFFLKRFDRVSTISNKMMSIAQSKGVHTDKLILFPNWSQNQSVYYKTDRSFREALGVDGSVRIILYSGNLGNKQNLDFIPKAAHAFQEKNIENTLFVIVGDGAFKEQLYHLAAQYKLTNMIMLPIQPLSILASMLSDADLHLVLQKRSAGDNVFPSKLTNILAVGGHAIVSADNDTELGELIDNNPGLAYRVEPENFEAFLGFLLKRFQLGLPEKPNMVATEFAKNNLDESKILSAFHKEICALVDG